MKKNMKKMIAMLLTMVFLAGLLTACSSGSGETAGEPAAEGTGETAEESSEGAGSDGYTFAYLSADVSVEFFAQQSDFIKAYCESLGHEFRTVDAAMDMQVQLDQVTQMTAAGEVDAILMNPVDTTLSQELVDAAGDVPIVMLNRMPVASIRDGYQFVYIGSEEKEAGSMQVEATLQWAEENGVDVLNYVVLLGQSGARNAEDRRAGAIEALEAEDIESKEVATVDCEWARAKAMEQVEALLATGDEFNVFFGGNDEAALGAVEALDVAGLNPSDYCIVGIDCIADALTAIEEGKMYASIFQDNQGQSETAVDTALKLLAGETVEESIWVPYEIVTAENVADYK